MTEASRPRDWKKLLWKKVRREDSVNEEVYGQSSDEGGSDKMRAEPIPKDGQHAKKCVTYVIFTVYPPFQSSLAFPLHTVIPVC